jgi:dipeptidyl aminopeptidase/acylaminoacyl peptidase
MVVGAQNQIGIHDVVENTWRQLTFKGSNSYPVWTPDGKRVTFTSNVYGKPNLYWKAVDGSTFDERLTSSDDTHVPHSWTPEGATLAFVQVNTVVELRRRLDIAVLDIKGDHKPEFLLSTAAIEDAPMFSPDGRWLAYVSDDSGQFEVYVQPFPATGGAWKVSKDGGSEPLWARNGRELFYRNGDKLLAVDVATQPTFSAGTPKVLFEKHYRRAPLVRTNYDVSLDGQSFLMIDETTQPSGSTQLEVISDWFEELRHPFGNQTSMH